MRKKKIAKTGINPEIVLCKKSKRFENIIVCTYQCFDRCEAYFDQFDMELVNNYIDSHPDYEIKGVIMGKDKKIITPTTDITKEREYWVITDENQYVEVKESEIINNPADYFGKPMYEKPKDQYEVVVAIKKKTK